MNHALAASVAVTALFVAACGGATTDTTGAAGASGAAGAATGSAGSNAGGSATAGTGGNASGGSMAGGAGGCESFVPCCDATGHAVPHQCAGGFPQCPPGSSFPATGVCQPAAPVFVCGPITCASPAQYCERQVSDEVGVPDSFTCKPVPPDCAQSDVCACLQGVPCGTSCSTDPSENATVVCPGG